MVAPDADNPEPQDLKVSADMWVDLDRWVVETYGERDPRFVDDEEDW